MQQIRAIFIILAVFVYSDLCMAQGGGIDFYNIYSAKLAKENTIDFKIKSSFQNLSRDIITVSTLGDTFYLVDGSSLGDLEWSIKYGFKRWAEFSVTGSTHLDKNQNSYRYGAGDTKIGFKFGTGRENAGIDMAADLYYTIATGFNEGNRLIRRFSANKNTWGGDVFMDFNFDRFSIKINGGYSNNGGKTDRLYNVNSIFWYPLIAGTLGLDDQGNIIRSSQFNFGFGGDLRLLNWASIFGEYKSNQIFSKQSGSVNLGNAVLGFIFGNIEKTSLMTGYIMPFGENQFDSGIIFNLRFNGLFSEVRRRREVSIPAISEETPALVPGRKPFFSREGVYFSGTRKPVTDTVFLIDISPSMVGRGLLADKGSNVLEELTSFVNAIIDSSRGLSNIAIVTFGNEISSLMWSAVTRDNQDKKDEMKKSVNDLPDNVNEFVQNVESGNITGTVEDLASGLDKAYEILEAFKRADYNRIHIQRIILFTDDIRDDAEEDKSIEQKISRLTRKYNIKRNDFRFIYYLLTNQEPGKRVKEYIINFIENEDGAIMREVNFAQQNEYIRKMNFNETERKPIFQYLSQVTSLAVINFKTSDKFSIGNQLTDVFKSVFDYTEYFKIIDQVEVNRVVDRFGLSAQEKIEITEAQKVGKQLGVDYIVTGEIIDFQINREEGFYLPKLLGLPKTEMSIKAAINLIDVADGSLVFVETIPAEYSFRRGISLFPSTREDKTKYLSTLEKDVLMNELMQKWSNNLKMRLFLNLSIGGPTIIP